MKEKPRILVTYGCHKKEKFAINIGIKFRELDLENIIVAGWKGIRGLNRNAKFRREIRAVYGIDLHDDSPRRDWALQHLEDPSVQMEIKLKEKYMLCGHMGWDKALKLLKPFEEEWNKEHGKECHASGCDCYGRDYLYYGMRRPCRANIVGLEYLTLFSGLTLDEGVNFLEKLCKHLQLYG